MIEDSIRSKYNRAKTFDVGHYAKRYWVSQGITGSCKMHFFSIISILNDSKFYDEERNELS